MAQADLELEKKYLKFSTIGNLLVGCMGCAVAALSTSQAILLDGVFNLTYFVTGLFTVRVASLVAGGDDERFPHGYAFFEPLVNGVKGTLVLGVSVMALMGAVQALMSGGRSIAAGAAIGYGIVATIACGIVAVVTRRGARTTGSPLVSADAENWAVNAAISSCVMLAFATIFLLRAVGMESVVPYVDPAVVLTIVMISIGIPVRMAYNSLMELLNRAPAREIVDRVTEIVDAHLSNLPVQERFVRVIQPGRLRLVLVHVVLPTSYRPQGLGALDTIRDETYKALTKEHMATIVDILFTADRQWGAPISQGGAGPLTMGCSSQ